MFIFNRNWSGSYVYGRRFRLKISPDWAFSFCFREIYNVYYERKLLKFKNLEVHIMMMDLVKKTGEVALKIGVATVGYVTIVGVGETIKNKFHKKNSKEEI